LAENRGLFMITAHVATMLEKSGEGHATIQRVLGNSGLTTTKPQLDAQPEALERNAALMVSAQQPR